MCVIIDACVQGRVFSSRPDEDVLPVIKWIEDGDGRVAYGGSQLTRELLQREQSRRRLREWKRAGRALEFPARVVDEEEGRVRRLDVAQSNDTHIIALARVSGARTLFSTDRVLHADFRNMQLIANPRGQVYQTRSHSHLLMHTSSCRASHSRVGEHLWT